MFNFAPYWLLWFWAPVMRTASSPCSLVCHRQSLVTPPHTSSCCALYLRALPSFYCSASSASSEVVRIHQGSRFKAWTLQMPLRCQTSSWSPCPVGRCQPILTQQVEFRCNDVIGFHLKRIDGCLSLLTVGITKSHRLSGSNNRSLPSNSSGG